MIMDHREVGEFGDGIRVVVPDIEEGDRVWAIDDGSSGTVDEIYYAEPPIRGVAQRPVATATVVWDRTGCCGDVPLNTLRKMTA